jgi:hypothetical protein
MGDCVLWNIINDINFMLSFLGALDFDLEKERIGLDEQGLKIAENQETSQKNRRKLAENTRDFKKASPDAKLSLFNSLLKSYQEEVDNLTKRAKFGENTFLNIYQKLYEAPDPYPALASMAVCSLNYIVFCFVQSLSVVNMLQKVEEKTIIPFPMLQDCMSSLSKT